MGQGSTSQDRLAEPLGRLSETNRGVSGTFEPKIPKFPVANVRQKLGGSMKKVRNRIAAGVQRMHRIGHVMGQHADGIRTQSMRSIRERIDGMVKPLGRQTRRTAPKPVVDVDDVVMKIPKPPIGISTPRERGSMAMQDQTFHTPRRIALGPKQRVDQELFVCPPRSVVQDRMRHRSYSVAQEARRVGRTRAGFIANVPPAESTWTSN